MNLESLSAGGCMRMEWSTELVAWPVYFLRHKSGMLLFQMVFLGLLLIDNNLIKAIL